MTIDVINDVLTVHGSLSVEDAERLQTLLLEQSCRVLDLAACEHMHAACLQVLLAAHCSLAQPPTDPVLAAWLSSALPSLPENKEPT